MPKNPLIDFLIILSSSVARVKLFCPPQKRHYVRISRRYRSVSLVRMRDSAQRLTMII